MGVVAEIAQRVAVMYAGQVMEERAAADLFGAPQHPYTAALLAARAGAPRRRAACHHSRHGAEPLRSAARLPVRPALRLCDAALRADVRPELRSWMGGKVRCHYPLGDPTRDARIATDRQHGKDSAA